MSEINKSTTGPNVTDLEVFASPKCPTCGEDIRPAKCREGWCDDCERARVFGAPYLSRGIEVFCRAHRMNVNFDDHCSLWVSG